MRRGTKNATEYDCSKFTSTCRIHHLHNRQQSDPRTRLPTYRRPAVRSRLLSVASHRSIIGNGQLQVSRPVSSSGSTSPYRFIRPWELDCGLYEVRPTGQGVDAPGLSSLGSRIVPRHPSRSPQASLRDMLHLHGRALWHSPQFDDLHDEVGGSVLVPCLRGTHELYIGATLPTIAHSRSLFLTGPPHRLLLP